jgi:hypothetical protein
MLAMDQTTIHKFRLVDKSELQTLLGALNGAKNSLGLDACGDYMIEGSRGTIRACNGKFFMYLAPGSARAWGFVKKALASIATPSQDGDDEGILTFDRIPTDEEAEVIRHYIGLRQTRDAPPNSF